MNDTLLAIAVIVVIITLFKDFHLGVWVGWLLIGWPQMVFLGHLSVGNALGCSILGVFLTGIFFGAISAPFSLKL